MKYTRKTFGAKQCHEEVYPNGTRIFISYATPVCAYVPGLGYLETMEYYSRTTNRQITFWHKENDYPMTQATTEWALKDLRDECLRIEY